MHQPAAVVLTESRLYCVLATSAPLERVFSQSDRKLRPARPQYENEPCEDD